MKDLKKVYESLRERMKRNQQIVVELNKSSEKSFPVEYVITDRPATMSCLLDITRGWDAINAKVSKLISDGMVADIYLDYQ